MLEYRAYCLSSIIYQAIAKNVVPILTVPDFFVSLKRCRQKLSALLLGNYLTELEIHQKEL